MTEENSLAATAAVPAAEPPSKPLLSWQTATAIATASVSVGAVLLHAIGSIRDNIYLAQFGMGAGVFPKINIYFHNIRRYDNNTELATKQKPSIRCDQ